MDAAMTIGVLMSAICAAVLGAATAVALETGMALVSLAYVTGGSLGVTLFVGWAELQRRGGPDAG